MNLLKTPRIKDLAYRKSFRGQPCEASRNGIDLCGLRSVETVVGAHIRVGEYSGMGQKPSDDLILALCHDCHRDESDNPGAEWYLENIVKPMARRRHRSWLNENM